MSYTILPFRFYHYSETEVFLSNEAGEFAFLSNDDFYAFVQDRLSEQSPCFEELEYKQFLATGHVDDVIAMLATKYRTKKAFLRDFTELHMIVPSLRCNSSCIYCQVSRKRLHDTKYNMTYETADNVLKTIFQSPAPAIKIEFQGGDPAAYFDMVEYLIEKANVINILKKKDLSFVICTNTTLLSEKNIKYLRKHDVQISTSLDGPKDLHNLHRPLQDGADSYEILMQNISKIREIYGNDYSVSALMTTTKHSLGRFREIIDEYIRCGFSSIFLRPLNPYGFAKNYKEKVAYDINDFVENFKDAINYIIDLNLNGKFFMEGYTSILLKRIMTPFTTGFVDLQSPAGAGISCAIYDWDGSVYMSDEGRMMARFKNYFFKLGNVNTDDYQSLFNGDKIHQVINDSCVDTLPGCAFCAFAPYCGADPVRNMSEQGSVFGFRPTNEMCHKNKAIIKFILDLIKKNDPEINKVLWSWVR